jgi:hypothetical protein
MLTAEHAENAENQGRRGDCAGRSGLLEQLRNMPLFLGDLGVLGG